MSDRDDDLTTLRGTIDAIDDVPLDERPALFEGVHRAIVAELRTLEEL